MNLNPLFYNTGKEFIIDSFVEFCVNAVVGKKAFAVSILDVAELTSIADVFIICSARSNRQVSAIAEHVVTDLKKKGIRPISTDGIREGQWVLLDYGSVVIHVFYESMREFYDLDGLWADARRIPLDSFSGNAAAAAAQHIT